MPHTALILTFMVGLASAAGAAGPGAGNPHLDPSQVAGGCSSCHKSHGVSRSPQLPGPQLDVCLSCHGTRGDADRQRMRGHLAHGTETTLLSTEFSMPHTHPLTPDGLSRRQEGVVTCTSCHSPHSSPKLGRRGPGVRNVSTRNPQELEFELCNGCHGSLSPKKMALVDIAGLTNPQNRSFHPIESPTLERSSSVLQDYSGVTINCTDCHGSSNSQGPRGPHGSQYSYLLVARYDTSDGGLETVDTYELCYGCHDRGRVLYESPFPYHDLHVVEERTSCSACHSAHGSVDNRALIRFGEEGGNATVTPSMSTGRLAFESMSQGIGTCFLTCHGEDHGPESYGPGSDFFDAAWEKTPLSRSGRQAPAIAVPPSRKGGDTVREQRR